MSTEQITPTDHRAPGAPMPEPAPLTVTAPPASRLEQLHAAYADAKAEQDAAAKKLKAITDAIKVEVTSLDPNERRFEITGASGAPPLRLTYVESWRVDSKRLKAEQPELYVAYAKQSGAWTLKAGA